MSQQTSRHKIPRWDGVAGFADRPAHKRYCILDEAAGSALRFVIGFRANRSRRLYADHLPCH